MRANQAFLFNKSVVAKVKTIFVNTRETGLAIFTLARVTLPRLQMTNDKIFDAKPLRGQSPRQPAKCGEPTRKTEEAGEAGEAGGRGTGRDWQFTGGGGSQTCGESLKFIGRPVENAEERERPPPSGKD